MFEFCNSSFKRKMPTILSFIISLQTFSCFLCVFIVISELCIVMIRGCALTEAQIVVMSQLLRGRTHQRKSALKEKELHLKERAYRKAECTKRENADIELAEIYCSGQREVTVSQHILKHGFHKSLMFLCVGAL